MKRLIRFTIALTALQFGIRNSELAMAQDIHFSQFYETSILRNPALVGIFTDDYKLTAVYRNQWSSIGKPFTTGLGSAEFRVPIGREAVNFISFGLLGYSDKAGRAALKTTGVYPALNYNQSLGDRHNSYVSVGFTGGYVVRSFDASKLSFDNEYVNGVYLQNSGPGEPLPDGRLQHWDAGAGVSFNSGVGEDNKLNYFIGLAGYHFSQPRRNFYSGVGINLNMRWNASLGLHATLNDTWSAELHGNYALQGSYQEIVLGGTLRFAGTNDRNRQVTAFAAGVFYRFKDAVVPTVKVDYKGQSFGLSYDINLSSLKAATNLQGGLEATLSFHGLFQGTYDDKHACPRF